MNLNNSIILKGVIKREAMTLSEKANLCAKNEQL